MFIAYFLQWDLFPVKELEHYDAMLTRLLKEECEEIVMGYEAYRMQLLHEYERRTRMIASEAGGELLPIAAGERCSDCNQNSRLDSFMDNGFDYPNDLCVQNALWRRLDAIEILQIRLE